MARTKQTARKADQIAPLKIQKLRPQLASAVKRTFLAKGGIKKPTQKQQHQKIKKSAPRETTETETQNNNNNTDDNKDADDNDNNKENASTSVKLSQKRRASIYRRIASRACGFSMQSDSSNAAKGMNSSKCLVSVRDMQQLMKNCPEKDASLRTKTQKEVCERALQEGAPISAARSVTVYADQLMRQIMLDSVHFSIASRQKKVTAAAVYHVIRNQAARLSNVSGPAPFALIRHAQRIGSLGCNEDDTKEIAKEKRVAAASKKRNNQTVRDETRDERRRSQVESLKKQKTEKKIEKKKKNNSSKTDDKDDTDTEATEQMEENKKKKKKSSVFEDKDDDDDDDEGEANPAEAERTQDDDEE